MMISVVVLIAGLTPPGPAYEVLTLSTGEQVVVTKQHADQLHQLARLSGPVLAKLARGGGELHPRPEPPQPTPKGAEKVMKFIEQSLRWLQQQQRKGSLSNTERFVQALREASDQQLSHTERAMRSFQIFGSPKH